MSPCYDIHLINLTLDHHAGSIRSAINKQFHSTFYGLSSTILVIFAIDRPSSLERIRITYTLKILVYQASAILSRHIQC
jgi:hypothetical protein